MKTTSHKNRLNRREFCEIITKGGISATLYLPFLKSLYSQSEPPPEKPATNIKDALKIPRKDISLPGIFPGRIIQVHHSKSVVNNKPDLNTTLQMLEKGMLELTGAPNLASAWQIFVSPEDIIGLKVNPVAGKLLSTSLEITQAIIQQLKVAGILRQNIIIWDRREFQLHETGFTIENFPGVQILGTELQDSTGSFFEANGKLLSEKMIDKNWYYWADCEMNYDENTLPYMVNEGKCSYFSKIVTEKVTKIINIPILKNAGSTVTLCLKNLAYGAITNTARLHKQLWSETSAEVPCFAPLRDKVVLNIVDGLIGCYNGGPGAKPEFITEYNTMIIGTDPVATDRVGYEIVLKKRLQEKIQTEENPQGRVFMDLAKNNKIGESSLSKIDLNHINLG